VDTHTRARERESADLEVVTEALVDRQPDALHLHRKHLWRADERALSTQRLSHDTEVMYKTINDYQRTPIIPPGVSVINRSKSASETV